MSLHRWWWFATVVLLVICLTSSAEGERKTRHVTGARFVTAALETLNELTRDGLMTPVTEHLKQRIDDKYTNVTCAEELVLWLDSVFQRDWAFKMFDASGKFPPGISGGNVNSLGQFDMCYGLRESVNAGTTIAGKYCLVKSRLVTVAIPGDGALKLAICIPASCTAPTLQTMISDTLESLGVTKDTFNVIEDDCQLDGWLHWDAADIVAVVILVDCAILVLVGTAYDIYSRYFFSEIRFHKFLVAFSVYTNTQKLIQTPNDNSIKCLNGLRVLSMLWIILGNRFRTSTRYPLLNTNDLVQWNADIGSTFIMSTSFAADTFLLISGLLLANLFYRKMENFKSFNILLFYLHRIVRLLPLLAAIVFFNATVFKFVSSGPLWPAAILEVTQPCKDYWWTTLLFVNNYVNPMEMCLPHTWHLAVDMQLYILSPILLYPLMRNASIGLANCAFWTIIAQVTVIILVYVHQWPASPIIENERYLILYYFATHTRAVPWLLGFITGYVLYRSSKVELVINKIIAIILWGCGLGILLVIILAATNVYNLFHIPNNLDDGTFNAFARLGWSLSLIWIIIACVHGYGGPIRWFLELNIWDALGRLSYSMFLIHPVLQVILSASARSVRDFSNYNIYYLYFGDLLFTIIISYLLTMTFEAPLRKIENAILTRVPKTKDLYRNGTNKISRA